MRGHACAFTALLAALGASAPAQTPPAPSIAVEHRGVGCVVADKFPRFEARLKPSNQVARARVHFRPEGGSHWYSVAMKAERGSWSGVIPKPKKGLKRLNYYIEATHVQFATARTQEFAADVVEAGRCKGDRVVAGALSSATVTVIGPPGVAGVPVVPAGFSQSGVAGAGGGVGAGTVVVAAVGAAVVAAGALGTAKEEAWTGTTSQGLPLELTVINPTMGGSWVDFVFFDINPGAGCPRYTHGGTVIFSRAAIDGGRVTIDGNQTGIPGLRMNGSFSGDNASGTADYVTPNIFGPLSSCVGRTGSLSWTASKRSSTWVPQNPF